MRPINYTRELGRAQGYIPLPVRDDFITNEDGTKQTHCMVTAWQPTPEELRDLNAGAMVYLSIVGQTRPIGYDFVEQVKESGHPPVMIFTGPVPTNDLET